MLRRHRQIRMQLHQVLDACLFAAGFCLAYVLRASPLVTNKLGLVPVSPFSDYIALYLILIPAAPLLLEAQGFYDRPMLGPRLRTAWQLFKGCLLTTIGLILAVYFFNLTLARWVIIWFGVISFVVVFLKEEALRRVYRRRLGQSQFRRRFVLVGTVDEIARMRAELKARPEVGVDIVGELNLSETPVEKLVGLLHEHAVNGVMISAKHTYFEQVEAVIKACEREGVEAWVGADFFGTQISRTSFDDFYGRPIMVFRTTPEASWQGVLKQVGDTAAAFLLLAVLAAPFAVIALLIKLASPGPVFFRQQRCGLNGRPFTMFKFRTMVTDAEQRKRELAAFNEMDGPVFKMSNDPRVTRIGRWLRRFSLDEFPQLLNVLRGEMSLVGPRPLPVEEVKRFDDVAHRRRLSVKPGLTCLWQISGRNEVKDFKDWVRLDLEYIDNWSLWLDVKILCHTVPIVLSGAGAK